MIKTPEEIKIMTEGGKILAGIMKKLIEEVKPGVTTKQLDRLAESLVLKSGGEPSFKGYKGFPATLCVSINKEVVHVAPSQREIKEGDIVSLDVGMKYKGLHNDMAVTLGVGEISSETQRLIWAGRKALKRAIKKVRPGITIGDISNTIQRYVEDQGFKVVRELCGHGIGRELHEEPEILNYGRRHTGPVVKEGMVFCLEPIICLGDWKLKRSKDGYGYIADSLSVHFEHQIAVIKDGCKVLTK